MTKVSITDIREAAKTALMAHGADDWIAEVVADATADSESLGNKVCGLYYLESYCQQLVSGRVKGAVEPAVTRPRPGSVAVDAKFGFAQAGFARGLPEAVKATRENGIAYLAVGQAHTCTSLGYFTHQIAMEGLIGLGMTNASACVAPPGGNAPVLGTNPIAFSVPKDGGGVGLHYDFSTSVVAKGKITMAQAAGQPIPEGWAVDSGGNPTKDPAAALAGAQLSAGGYKGWGIGLMVELLAAGMTASVNSLDVPALKSPAGDPHNLGQFYILIDPQSDQSDFYARFARVADAVGEQPGGRLPGLTLNRADAVDVPDALWKLVQTLQTRA